MEIKIPRALIDAFVARWPHKVLPPHQVPVNGFKVPQALVDAFIAERPHATPSPYQVAVHGIDELVLPFEIIRAIDEEFCQLVQLFPLAIDAHYAPAFKLVSIEEPEANHACPSASQSTLPERLCEGFGVIGIDRELLDEVIARVKDQDQLTRLLWHLYNLRQGHRELINRRFADEKLRGKGANGEGGRPRPVPGLIDETVAAVGKASAALGTAIDACLHLAEFTGDIAPARILMRAQEIVQHANRLDRLRYRPGDRPVGSPRSYPTQLPWLSKANKGEFVNPVRIDIFIRDVTDWLMQVSVGAKRKECKTLAAKLVDTALAVLDPNEFQDGTREPEANTSAVAPIPQIADAPDAQPPPVADPMVPFVPVSDPEQSEWQG